MTDSAYMTRRGFCGGIAATAIAGVRADAADASSNLRVGIVSDIHVVAPRVAAWLEKALRYFDAVKVDAVAIPGDFTCYSRISEMRLVADTWNSVFPGDRRSDGGHVEKLFITGNHDTDAWNDEGKGPGGFKGRSDAEANCFYFNREKVWREFFGEEYAQVVVKEVKGYVFVMRNWISFYGNPAKCKSHADLPLETNPICEKLAELRGRLRGDRPFFYMQHDQLRDTVNAPWLVHGKKFGHGQDDGRAMSVLKDLPNCLALTGHNHSPLTDELAIWQGAFTAVSCGALGGFAFTSPGRENGFSGPDFGRVPAFEMDNFDNRAVHHGMVMDVFDDRITFAKRDFSHDLPIGEDWVVPLFGGRTVPAEGVPKYDFATRAAAGARNPPQFASDAAIKVKKIAKGRKRLPRGFAGLDMSESHAQVEVSFPPVTTAHSPVRGYDYAVRLEHCIGDCERVLDEKRVFSPNGMQAEACETEPVKCLFSAAAFPNRGEVRFAATALDCWGNRGNTIYSDWRKI